MMIYGMVLQVPVVENLVRAERAPVGGCGSLRTGGSGTDGLSTGNRRLVHGQPGDTHHEVTA